MPVLGTVITSRSPTIGGRVYWAIAGLACPYHSCLASKPWPQIWQERSGFQFECSLMPVSPTFWGSHWQWPVKTISWAFLISFVCFLFSLSSLPSLYLRKCRFLGPTLRRSDSVNVGYLYLEEPLGDPNADGPGTELWKVLTYTTRSKLLHMYLFAWAAKAGWLK